MSIRIVIKRVISIFITCLVLVSATLLVNIEKISAEDRTKQVITEGLWKAMDAASDKELIPVTIELISEMNNDEIEATALQKSNLTKEKMQEIESAPTRLSDEENIIFQKENAQIYNEFKKERINAIKEYNTCENASFIVKNNLQNKECHSVSLLTPFIRGVYLTKDEIIELAQDSDVLFLHCTDLSECVDYASLEFSRQIIGGDIAISEGYTGSGIKVGNIESGHPNLTIMGTDSTGITLTNSGNVTDHATIVCAILKKMAPDCTIYTRAANSVVDIVDSVGSLVYGYHVDVINIVRGQSYIDGVYTAESRELDYYVKALKVTIVVAAGQSSNSDNSPDTYCINNLGLAPNVITVGYVSTLGTDPSASNAFFYRENNYYKENRSCINKPDVCAPGNVSVYGYNNYSGTSFAAPHVTGTVVQMMCRNVWLKDKPETIKAALMASAQYNAGTSMSHVSGTIASDKEGAGVINSGFCYRVAKNGRRAYFDATASNSTFSQNIYCDYSTKPFRVACAWEVISTKDTNGETGTTVCTDFNMRIYKNGVLVASSTANSNSSVYANTNYEIIEIPASVISQYGAGYYQVQIFRSGPFIGNETVRIGLAWEQI